MMYFYRKIGHFLRIKYDKAILRSLKVIFGVKKVKFRYFFYNNSVHFHSKKTVKTPTFIVKIVDFIVKIGHFIVTMSFL
jgi:hypothetical protein